MELAGRVIGLLHPGEMGAAVGRCLVQRGHTVLWASDGRGPESAARARGAGLEDAGTAAEIADQAEIIMSVCPPHAALDVAWAVQGFDGIFADANAISPASAREVARMIEDGGGSYVDGGIIGPPPASPGTTRLYLSGPRAGEVSELLDGTALAAPVLTGSLTAASAVKMAYAGWTKGSGALLLTAQALARAEGVEQALLDEWAQSLPGLADRAAGAAAAAAAKGWRWVAEMEEIAVSMSTAGLPDGFHQAAAEIFRRSPARSAQLPPGPVLDTIIEGLIDSGSDQGDRRPDR